MSTTTPTNQTIGSTSTSNTARPDRLPSIGSLRNSPRSNKMSQRGEHARRRSLDINSSTQNQPSGPITYFPNPSSFHSNPPTLSPRTSTYPLMSSRPSSLSMSSTDDEMDIPSTAPVASTSAPGAVTGGGTGAQTPKMGHMRHSDSTASSPRLGRSSIATIDEQARDPQDGRSTPRRVSNSTSNRPASVTGPNGMASGHGANHANGNGYGGHPTRTLSTPVPGYGSTHHPPVTAALAGLGLDQPDNIGSGGSRKGGSRRDDALASPRRISTSTSSPMPPERQKNGSQHRSPGGMLNLPGHEAYYSSQPGTTTSARFRDQDLPTARPHGQHFHHGHGNHGHMHHRRGHGSGSTTTTSRGHNRHDSLTQGMNSSLLSASTSMNSGLGLHQHQDRHQRNLSVQTTDLHGTGTRSPAMKSPAHSMIGKLRKTASAVGFAVGRPEEYDDSVGDGGDEENGDDNDSGTSSNGTRVWYSSFVTIDWIHDAIKDSARVRRLRHNASKSWRGAIANAWDRFQGWLVVTIIGFVSAIIAFMIIRSEMALFDLKEGFCSTSWGSARRFCCSPHTRKGPGNEEEKCGDWVEWGEFFAPREKGGPDGEWIWGGPEFIAYAIVALSLATLSSVLTIYLSSSAHHTTSKDSTFLLPDLPTPGPGPGPKSSTTTPPRENGERQPLLASPDTFGNNDLREPSEPPRKIMYYAAGSGIPEIKTILSGFVIHGYLGGWTLLTKSVGLALSVASGLSLGKEGPLVHISSCVGNIVSRMFIKFECNEAKRREILSAACAAGVAVAFGAPIGGVLFSLEEVSYYFPPKVMWRSFWCAAVAAITLKSLNPFGNGSLVLFAVTYTKTYHYWEYIIFFILGIFGGIYGAIFSRLNILWSKHIRQGTWVKSHPIIEVLLVTALTTVLSFLNPYCRMGGTELVASLFAECHPGSTSGLCVEHPHEIAKVISAIGGALLVKGGLTIITFGVKLPAGIFIPSLAVGACFGRIVGLAMEWVEHEYPDLRVFGVCKDETCIVPGLYAMIGAAATLAGVTRTTVSLAVIVLELTNTLNYVVPVMLGVLVAKTVADGLEKKGIYDLVIDLNQLPYLDSKGEYLWGGRKVAEIAERDIPNLRADKTHTVRSLTGKLLELVRLGMADTGFPVLVKETMGGEGGRLFTAVRVVGFLGMNELEHALNALADEPDAILNLMPEDTSRPKSSVLSIFSFAESYNDPRNNPYDISRYIDRAPIIVQLHSPLELVQQLFAKLGARQILVTDSRGVFRGMVTKKAWLNFLTELEEEQS